MYQKKEWSGLPYLYTKGGKANNQNLDVYKPLHLNSNGHPQKNENGGTTCDEYDV